MKVDGQIFSENHSPRCKAEYSKSCRISSVIGNTYDCTLIESRIVSNVIWNLRNMGGIASTNSSLFRGGFFYVEK